ncbi:MAG: radical SAM protein [Chloroflexi bacterium]|nr:radical SAM protein [Chloroflexota bacterium]
MSSLRIAAQARDATRRALTLLSIMIPVRPLVGPARANIQVSNRCNFDCIMCPYHSRLAGEVDRFGTGLMDTAVAARVLKGAARIGVDVVTLSGKGEPLLHPELGQIVRMARSYGLRPEVFTNGSLLTQRRMEELIEAGLYRLRVSLVGASPESHVRYHPNASRDLFGHIVHSLELFQQLKRRAGATAPQLDLHFIVLAGSSHEVERMVNLGIELGAESIHLTPLRNRFVGEIGSLAPSRDEEGRIVERLHDLTPRAARAGLETNIDEIRVYYLYGPMSRVYPCYAGWFDVPVSADGTIMFCPGCATALGNVRERPLEEIWRSAKYQALRRSLINPLERAKIANCECDRCCHFCANWRIARRLASIGLAPMACAALHYYGRHLPGSRTDGQPGH